MYGEGVAEGIIEQSLTGRWTPRRQEAGAADSTDIGCNARGVSRPPAPYIKLLVVSVTLLQKIDVIFCTGAVMNQTAGCVPPDGSILSKRQ